MSDLTRTADLYICLSSPADGQYRVDLRFFQPEDQIEKDSTGGQAVFLFDDLRASALKPLIYGELLCKAVFGDGPNERSQYYAKALANAQGSGQELRLRILFDHSARRLHDLRWEMLRDPDGKSFLAADANRPFSRFLSIVDWQRIDLRPRASLRALVFIANPRDLQDSLELAEVDVEGEIRRAQEGLCDYPLSLGIREVPKIEVVESQAGLPGRASFESLKTSLRQGYDILYLVCHGALVRDRQDFNLQHPYLVLEKDDGSSVRQNGEDLVMFIRNLPVDLRPRLVVLASCQSGGKGRVSDAGLEEEAHSYDQGALSALGPRLVEAGIPAVVAQQDNVRMVTIRKFTPAFFGELLRSSQVDKAMAVARNVIMDETDWWVPVLYTCLRSGLIFPVSEISDAERSQRVGQGLGALAEAMHNPKVREAAIAYQVVFRNTSAQIEVISLYKKLHDGFQKLETDYPLIEASRKAILDDADAWMELELHAGTAGDTMDEILEIARAGHALIEPPMWLETLATVKAGLQNAAANHDQAILDRSTNSFRRILNREITRINDNLVTVARSLQLSAIVQAMCTIQETIGEADQDSQLVAQINQGVENLEALSERLTSLVSAHNTWQELDDQLRLGETSIEDEPSEFLEEIWPQVKSLGQALYGSQDLPWALALKEQAVKLEQSFSAASIKQISYSFQRYRTSGSQRFRKVDKELLDLCVQLQQIGNSVHIIIRIFDE